jgi:hypothetical protein
MSISSVKGLTSKEVRLDHHVSERDRKIAWLIKKVTERINLCDS